MLLVHKPRKNDAWQIPQGGIEEGETVELAGRRELKEETNVELPQEIFTCPQFYQYDYPQKFIQHEKPRFKGQRLDFVAAFVPRDTVVTVDQRELDRYRWLHPKGIWRFLKRREYRKTVLQAIEWAEKKVATSQ